MIQFVISALKIEPAASRIHSRPTILFSQELIEKHTDWFYIFSIFRLEDRCAAQR